MRFRVRTKDCRLIVRAKLAIGEKIDEQALDAFERVYLRGFLKVKRLGKGLLEYSGPMGDSLHERLKLPITSRDFLFIMEHLVLAVQKLEANRLNMNNVILNLHGVFINDATKEVQFLYMPLEGGEGACNVLGFVESIVLACSPADQKDGEVISRFLHFVKKAGQFDPDKVERFIAYEDKSVISTLKKQNAGLSGIMTGRHKQELSDNGSTAYETANTIATVKTANRANSIHVNIVRASVQKTGLEKGLAHPTAKRDERSNAQLIAPQIMRSETKIPNDEEELCETGIMIEEASNEETDIATGLLFEEATGILDEEATGLLEVQATGLLETEETSLLVDNVEEQKRPVVVVYPTLYRLRTEKEISINKPVFRLGKEKSYVDGFIGENNAVSRSHADIVTRGENYYVVDLNSKNHTYINDQRIDAHTETEIQNGDILKLANEEFIFRVDTAPKARICPRCGKQADGDWRFCIYCGSQIMG